MLACGGLLCPGLKRSSNAGLGCGSWLRKERGGREYGPTQNSLTLFFPPCLYTNLYCINIGSPNRNHNFALGKYRREALAAEALRFRAGEVGFASPALCRRGEEARGQR